MKQVRDAFEKNHVVLDLDASDMTSAIHGTISHLVKSGVLPESVSQQVESAFLEREREAPTAIGRAVAIPHAYLEEIEEQLVVFVRLACPVNLGAPDGIPTRFLFFLLGPPNSTAQHMDTLANVARLMSDDEFRYEIGEAESRGDLLAALNHFASRISPETEPAKEVSDGLAYTGRLGGGLRQDTARRWEH
ncbi:MAG: PTS sugar transporter subunit IIA, partial [Planctomycetales bacterium]